MFSLTVLLFACTLETGFTGQTDSNGDPVDTGVDEDVDTDVADTGVDDDTDLVDTATPDDTASPVDTGDPVDTGEPVDTAIPAAATCTTAPGAGCEIRTWDGRDYLFCNDPSDWHSAEASCASMGDSCHLASANTEAENDYLFAELASTFGAMPDYWWIGLTEGATEGSWAWVDGSPWAYTDWGLNEPNDLGGEDCGHLFQGYQGWNDISCSNQYAYVCEAGM